MESSSDRMPLALVYVRQVKTKIAAADSQTSDQFFHILKQFRCGNIHSSVVVSTVEKLFHNYPDLIHAFKPFVPSDSAAATIPDAATAATIPDAATAAAIPDSVAASAATIPDAAAAATIPDAASTTIPDAAATIPDTAAATTIPATSAAAEDSDLTACVGFVNRVVTRFSGNGVYSKFLDCTTAYKRGEKTFSEVCDKVFKLFGNNQDLMAEFTSFLPESCIQESCRKRRTDFDHTNHGQVLGGNSNSGNGVDQETAALRRSKRRRTRNSAYVGGEVEEEAGASPQQMVVSSDERLVDFDMEDSLFEVDVQIENVKSTYVNAVKLMRRLCGRGFSPAEVADVHLEEHFTMLNLACIRNVYRKVLDDDGNLRRAIPELILVLMKKKQALEKSRAKIVDKWMKIRQSCC